MNPKTETRILAAYGAARALADVVDGHSEPDAGSARRIDL